MNLKLQYDPKRTIKLRKNEILNEFRTQFSHKFYEIFKNAEQNIWSESDNNFEFLDEVFQDLLGELDSMKSNLDQKAKAWSQVASIEHKVTTSIKPTKVKMQSVKAIESETDVNPQTKETNFEFNTTKSDTFGNNVINQTKPQSSPAPNLLQEDEFDFFDG